LTWSTNEAAGLVDWSGDGQANARGVGRLRCCQKTAGSVALHWGLLDVSCSSVKPNEAGERIWLNSTAEVSTEWCGLYPRRIAKFNQRGCVNYETGSAKITNRACADRTERGLALYPNGWWVLYPTGVGDYTHREEGPVPTGGLGTVPT
jgi:hypothetical protein